MQIEEYHYAYVLANFGCFKSGTRGTDVRKDIISEVPEQLKVLLSADI